jgi:uncharacterized glyoxalase superfamily protein PhnB
MVLVSQVPQRLSFVTLGTRHMRGRRDFYAAWGWQERDGGSDEFAQFAMGGVRLALYPLDLLGAEAAHGLSAPAAGWNGVTLAINVGSREQVDAAYRVALAAGARSTGEPVAREWGGCSAYVADPEGQRWEIAWLPDFDPTA